MPYKSQIQVEGVIEQARAMIEAEGAAELSLHQLAAALGVKAPSLYRYFPNKAAVLHAVNAETTAALVRVMEAAIGTGATDPLAQIMAMAHAYRDFAHRNPATYGLAFSHVILQPDAENAAQLAQPLEAAMARLTGAEQAHVALRGAWALIHGFVMLELSGQFQRPGDLDAAFTQSVGAYLRGWLQA